ncbi:hypothetical protein ACFOLA_04100 [Salinicoccus hispanicus]|uniref:Uncharacterized protein n=1 Tax=Salinicoccus hispanicus TaxID=157225 RepID=A0A6N8U3T9_9STAP|nr:hypothetical protein [Salinicoccus hispanicus]MXQ51997.1 hypothetical protein [Salinicoccus hispanicus]
MKSLVGMVGVIFVALLLSGCQDTENEAVDQNVDAVDESSQDGVSSEGEEAVEDSEENKNEETQEEPSGGSSSSTSNDEQSEETEENNDGNSDSEEVEEESSDEAAGNHSDDYEDVQMTPYYFIDSHTYLTETDYLTAYSISRDETQGSSLGDRLEQSLKESDPSEQEILASFTNMTVEWPELTVNFNEEGTHLSTTSAQTTFFYESLFGISNLYGIEEITFTNPDGEEDISVAQRLVDAPMIIEEESGLARGYYTIYDVDLEQTVFIPGGQVGEQIADEAGEPFSFPETVEAMATVDSEGASHDSAIVEGLEVVETSFEDGVATVQYTLDEEIGTEADRIVFENAIQLAALDFKAREVRLINDTLQESVTYPLIEK